jgi:gamma-butyrobetaine dioxygenase
MSPARWDWGRAVEPARLDEALQTAGIAWLRAPELAARAEQDPWAAAETLFGKRPRLLERQPIHAIRGGRTFSSGSMPAPFHSDSQMFRGVPPHLQVMACRQAAERGGESVYLDTWELLSRLETEDPGLLQDLFSVERHFPFVFGDVRGPTLTLRGGSLVFTHTPRPPANDALALRLQTWIDASPAIEVRAEAGDLIVIHNHRLLHGRRGFDDARRAFTRLLVWRPAPWPAPRRWSERARTIAAPSVPPEVGLEAHERDRRAAVVAELVRGVPAGILSAREKVPEPELYRWRDAALGLDA